MFSSRNQAAPVAALVVAMLLWGSSFIAMKYAVATLDPLTVVAGRMVVASLLLAFFWRRIRSVPYRRGDWKLIVLMAVFEPCMYFVFEGYALRFTTASQAGMVTAMLPLMTAVVARKALNEQVSRRTLAGFALSIAGVVWLTAVAAGSESAPRPALGNFLEFVAMVCATGYFVTLKHLCGRYNPWFLTAMQAFVGTAFFVPVVLVVAPPLPAAQSFGPLAAMAYLGSFVTLGAYGLYNYGVSKIPVNQASAYVNLIPVITVILGWLLLGENFAPQQYAASLLVFAGVWLSHAPARKAAKAS